MTDILQILAWALAFWCGVAAIVGAVFLAIWLWEWLERR